MRRALLVGVLSVLVVVPASVGIYMFAFGEEPRSETQYSSPSTQVVASFSSSKSNTETVVSPDAVYNARKSKTQLNDALMNNAQEIADRTGVTPEEVTAAVEEMEIKSWESTTLPESASVSQSFEMDLNGDATLITTYSYPDDEYVTLTNEEGSLTLRGEEETGEILEKMAA